MNKIYELIQNGEINTNDFVLLTKDGDYIVSDKPSMVDSTLSIHIGFNVITTDCLKTEVKKAYEKAKEIHKKYFPL